MTGLTQKRVAIAGALMALGLLIAANAHLVTLAFSSQPACAMTEDDPMPAKRAC